MKTFSSVIFMSIMFLLFGSNVVAQSQKDYGYESISEKYARTYVSILSSDSLQGRSAGSKGGQMAASYIISLLSDWGVEPLLQQGYRQNFDVVRSTDPYIKKWEISPDSVNKLKNTPKFELLTLSNILAAIPGKNSDEMVIIGAHYDHMGIDVPIDGDSCYNGADDNASGVSAVLQIAKAMKQSGYTPERTIVFAFWDGEERGLLGSRHFVYSFPSCDRIKVYMNFDMIGRGPKENPAHLSYFYSKSNPAFGEWLYDDCEKYKFSFEPDYRPSESLVSGSDNAPFARMGIPIVWYHTEGHSDYHLPSDVCEKINYSKLTDITRAAYLCVWRLANENKY